MQSQHIHITQSQHIIDIIIEIHPPPSPAIHRPSNSFGTTTPGANDLYYGHYRLDLRLLKIYRLPNLNKQLTDSLSSRYALAVDPDQVKSKADFVCIVQKGPSKVIDNENESATTRLFEDHVLGHAFNLLYPFLQSKDIEGMAAGNAVTPSAKADLLCNLIQGSKRITAASIEVKFCHGRNKNLLSDLNSDLRQHPFGFIYPDQYNDKPSEKTPAPPELSRILEDYDLQQFDIVLPDDPAQPGTFDFVNSQYMISQVWNQLIVLNLTFAILTDYYTTYFLIRHRTRQTLYISDPISLDDKSDQGFTLIHSVLAFLCLASEETIAMEPIRNPTSTSNPPPQHIPPVSVFHLSVPYPSGVFESTEYNKTDKNRMRCLQIPTNHFDLLGSIRMIFRTKGILYSPHHSVLAITPSHNVEDTSSPPSPSPPSPSATAVGTETPPSPAKTLDDSMPLLVLQDEVGCGHACRSWEGYLESDTEKVSIIAKIGPLELLENEYAIYKLLRTARVSGVPSCLGLYSTHEAPSTGVLILSHNGYAIDENVSSLEKEVLKKILQDIHEAGVLHTDIDWRHIIRNDRGMLSIIDFDLAILRIRDDIRWERMIQKEMDEFLCLLSEKGTV
ncbi:hypothetical protein FRC03_001068 [Tulasnella sp. 419]|nr:hypothetical protein FRC02_000905 [Tulasnella sp. 418]KAG8947255.1 hypothetical protein FRC03_001068 [Tulasnella sp. 419]